jgi:hypothetical protein
MAMTQREKYLAIGVASVVGLVGMQYGYNSIRTSMDKKQRKINAARAEVDKLDQVISQGEVDSMKLQALSNLSLPSDPEKVLSEYKTWLTEIGEDAGISGLAVKDGGRPRETKAYITYTFALTGQAKTDQVIELMAKFYDKNYLHTLDKVIVTPIARKRDEFNVSLTARAMAMKIAPPDQEPLETPSGRLNSDLDEYKDIILARNPFSPPNNAPEIKTGRELEITLGENWSHPLEADDEEGDRVDWELVGDGPNGLELRRGSLSWSPEETGEFEVAVRGTDTGWPAMSSEKRIRLVVKEAPKEEPKVEAPKFDAATKTFVSAIVSGQRGPEACIRSLTEPEPMWLAKGEQLSVGAIEAKILNINVAESFLELETDGKRWTMGMEESLADAYKKSLSD